VDTSTSFIVQHGKETKVSWSFPHTEPYTLTYKHTNHTIDKFCSRECYACIIRAAAGGLPSGVCQDFLEAHLLPEDVEQVRRSL